MKSLPSICFLLGVPRSGTTLLAHLLQNHPDLLAPPEPWLMLALDAFGKVDRDHAANAGLVEMATEEFLGRIDRHRVFRTMVETAYGQYLAKAGKKCFIDKTPRYWMALDLIDALFPEAPQIILFRNPYAIASSLKTTWNIPLLIEDCGPFHAPHVADLVLGIRKLAERRNIPGTHFVTYETLVAQPVREVRRLVEALGFDPERLQSIDTGRADYLRQGTFGDRKFLDRSKIDGSSINQWMSVLTVAEKQTVTDMVGPALIRELGYEKELRLAMDAGVVEKSPESTLGYREMMESWSQPRRSDNSAYRSMEGGEEKQHPERSAFQHAMQLPASTASANPPRLAAALIKSAPFKIYTSIPPRVDVEKQHQVLDSWRANGFTPVSVNHESEIDKVRAMGLDIEIERVPTPGKPVIAEILAVIRNSGAALAGIVNSDCVMIRYPNLAHSLSPHLEGGIFYTQRMETYEGAPTFKEACYGFDGFFFDVRFTRDIRNTKFRMGECWWDYWLPLRMGANGGRLLKLPQPILFHEKHKTNWLYADWLEYGEAFWQDLREWHNSVELPSGLTALIDRPAMGDESGFIAMETFRWLRERHDVAVPSLLPAEYVDVEGLLRVDKLVVDSGPGSTDEKRELTSLGEIAYALLKTSKRLLSEPALLKRRLKTAYSLRKAYGFGAVLQQIVRIGQA